jgi:putative ABC transport system ATP-binding protein
MREEDFMTAYELRGVTRTFGQGAASVQAVRDLDLGIGLGEFVAVQGPSGSGKTTLLQLLGGLDRATEGEVRFDGRDLGKLSDSELSKLRLETIGFVFQQFNLIPTLTAAQNVEVALAPRSLTAEERRTRVDALLGLVGLSPRASHLPSQLSGGEQQRVAIARALANAPRVLLADEPTGNLDSATGEEIIGLLSTLAENHAQTIVLVTHDASIAARAERIVRMADGRAIAEEPAEEVSPM